MAITLDTIKQLSPQRKAIAIVVILLLLGYFYYFFYLQSAIEKKATLSQKQAELEQQVIEKSRLAAQKDRYLKEVAKLQENLKMVLTKLPNEREIPELFQSVALSGKSAGIDFVLVEPQKVEKPAQADQKSADKKPGAAVKDIPDTAGKYLPGGAAKGVKASAKSSEPEKFYEEIPVKISVNGGFHPIVLFFERVANLPRIINIENITMVGEKDTKSKTHFIKTTCLMKTYMFVDKKDEGKKQ
jgi:type IV pilus assembly protein PilO